MIDYFALLQQPRQPWLDLDELKARYQALTLSDHPDTKPDDKTGVDFAAVNEAYRVLSDPKLRLQHLLQLEGQNPNASQSVPPELVDLFARIGNFVHATGQLLERTSAAQHALAVSLIRSDILTSRKEADEILHDLRQLHEEAMTKMHSLNACWRDAPDKIADLFRLFAYLTRWLQQVEERRFQLSA